MTFRGAAFLNIAKFLLSERADESYVRTAIGRAYYAAFLEARDFCESSGLPISSGNTHVEVRRCLESLHLEALAIDLRNLHTHRKHADYDVSRQFDDFADVAEITLWQAENIINRLASIDT